MSAVDMSNFTSQLMAMITQFVQASCLPIQIDETLLVNAIFPAAPKACVPPPTVAAFLATQAAAPQTDSPASPDSNMEHSDTTSVASSSHKSTAHSSTGTSESSDSEGTVTDSAQLTLVKSKRGPKRVATSRTPPAAASTSAAPIVAPTSTAPNDAASQSQDTNLT